MCLEFDVILKNLEMSIAQLPETIQFSRDFAERGQYENARIYYDGAIAQIQK